MPQIVALRAKDDSSRDLITVVLSQDAVCLGPDGEPWAGVSLNAQLARTLAGRLLQLANEIETQEEKTQPSFRPLVQITSVLVFHDGSGQGHRAVSLAFDFASRSHASVQIAGIYGVLQDRFAPSPARRDYEWHRAWIERLIEMYSQEAEQVGIDLQSTMVAANNETKLADLLDSNEFDLLILPRRFSDLSELDEASRKLRQQFAGAAQSTILLCP